IPADEYEVICINDGSPDNSLEVLLRLQKEYSNIHIINQQNQGVSRARNNGIDVATGKYLLFIDPDDSVEPDSFGRILEKAENNSAQISFLGYTVFDKDGIARKTVYNKGHKVGVFSGLTAYSHARGTGQTDPDRIWAVLIGREFLNHYGLRFLPGVPYLEDGELITRILCLAERSIFDGRPFYNRTTRTGSATNSILFHLPKATEGFLLSAVHLKQFQLEKFLNDNQRRFLNQPICKYVILTVVSARKPFLIRRIKEVTKRLNEMGFNKLDLNGLNRDYRRLGWTYNKSIWMLLGYQFLITIIRSFNFCSRGRHSLWVAIF
ncbi:MAG: glycosyltransferase, partial [Bacteroidales bacterium]|nr:glycosyltransferase [Bacteroidales bacterium]